MDSGNEETADAVVVAFVTVPNEEVAATLARTLVQERLVACVNIVPGVRSIYAWQGQVCDEAELLCVLKTRRTLFPALRDRIVALHPYEVPEIIALPLILGHPPYLDWVLKETVPPAPRK